MNNNHNMPNGIEREGPPDNNEEEQNDVEELIRIELARGQAAIVPEARHVFYAPGPPPVPPRAPAPRDRVLDLGRGRVLDLGRGRGLDLGQGRGYDQGRIRRRGNDRGGAGGGGSRLVNGQGNQQ